MVGMNEASALTHGVIHMEDIVSLMVS